MKKQIILTVLILVGTLISTDLCNAESNPKREFRATWLTTHYRIDWPGTLATSANGIAAQKRQLCAILDTLKAGNINAVMLQVRPTADAFYQSSYEPWSHNLTGTRGANPGYDPLQYAIEECHNRGIEIHA
ncbi:MAG: family 10 glycosylhydrolase, partial [Paludibacteraceae bacterium]|nr:family 10 glycosylhydrolase [Paludibacteraceae bacterium]